jgi:putative flippase GtrA
MAVKRLWEKMISNQVIRFVFSAGLGFITDVVLFYILNNFAFKNQSYKVINYELNNYYLSFSISFFSGVIVNFLVNRYVVFSESTLSPGKQFVRFVSVAIIGYFANLWVLKMMVQYIHLQPTVARIAAALSLFGASFFIHKLFSFNLSLRQHARANNQASS